MDDVKVYVETEINPTELEEKVKRAIENVFGNIPTELKPLSKGNLLTAEAEGIESFTKLYNLLRRERIRDATRTVLYEGIDSKTIVFFLNKQVAYAGHVSFSKETAESPLGPIKVKVTCKNPKEFIDWLAPKTT